MTALFVVILPIFAWRSHTRLEEREVLVAPIEQVGATAHIRTRKFISSAIKISEFKLALSQSQMEKWIANGVWAVHCERKIVTARDVITAPVVRITDRAKYPSRSFPLCLGLRQEIPRRQVLRKSRWIVAVLREQIAVGAKCFDTSVRFFAESGHGNSGDERWRSPSPR